MTEAVKRRLMWLSAAGWLGLGLLFQEVDWGTIAANTLTVIITLIALVGILLTWVTTFSYLMTGLDSLTYNNPPMSFLVFVVGISIAFRAKAILDWMWSKVPDFATEQTIFGFLFGVEPTQAVIRPLIDFFGYWAIILGAMIVALPNGIAAAREMIVIRIGHINATGVIIALILTTLFLVGLPTIHGKLAQLVSTMPDILGVIQGLFGGGASPANATAPLIASPPPL